MSRKIMKELKYYAPNTVLYFIRDNVVKHASVKRVRFLHHSIKSEPRLVYTFGENVGAYIDDESDFEVESKFCFPSKEKLIESL